MSQKQSVHRVSPVAKTALAVLGRLSPLLSFLGKSLVILQKESQPLSWRSSHQSTAAPGSVPYPDSEQSDSGPVSLQQAMKPTKVRGSKDHACYFYCLPRAASEFPCKIFSPFQFPSSPEEMLHAFMLQQNTLQPQEVKAICSLKVKCWVFFLFFLINITNLSVCLHFTDRWNTTYFSISCERNSSINPKWLFFFFLLIFDSQKVSNIYVFTRNQNLPIPSGNLTFQISLLRPSCSQCFFPSNC